MAKHLKSNDVKAIINTIYGWSDTKLTWDRLCISITDLVGKKPTRQSLYDHKDIVSAFLSKKNELKLSPQKIARPASLKQAAQRIKNLESRVKDLERQNERLLTNLTVLQYNAYKWGLTEAKMTAPLPEIDRERTVR